MIASTSEFFEGVVKEMQDRLSLDPSSALRLITSSLEAPEAPLSNDQRLRFELLHAEALIRLGDYDKVEALVTGLDKRVRPQTSYAYADLLSIKGYLQVQRQLFAQGSELLQQAHDMYLQLGDDTLQRREIYTNIVWHCHSVMMTRAARALELLLEARHYAHGHHLLYNKAARHGDLGVIYLLLEQYERAVEILEQARQQANPNDVSTLADINSSLGICHMHLRQIEPAIAAAERALALPNNRRNVHATSLITLAHCFIQRNELQRAEETLQQAEAISDKGIIRSAMNSLLYGQLYHKQGRHAEAIEKLEKALEHSRSTKVVRFEHRAALELASLYITVGNESKALECYRELYSLHYHSFIARQVGEVERMLAEEEGQKYVGIVNSVPDRDMTDGMESPAIQNSELLIQLTEVSLELNQKRRYLQQILTSLDALPDLKAGILKREVDQMQSGIRSQLSATVSWDSLDQKLIRLAGPDFQRALLKRGPNLTPTELRVCALIRCDLSTKEIAHMLGTSIRTVDTHRTRVRKKLGMGPADNLSTYLMGVI